MVKLYEKGVYLLNGSEIVEDNADSGAIISQKTGTSISKDEAKKGTIAYGILKSHNTSG